MAVSLNCTFEGFSELEDFILKNELQDYPSIMAQIFAGIYNTEKINAIISLLKSAIPKLVIIGCTTNGVIKDGKLSDNQIVLSFTAFEKTVIKSTLLHTKDFSNSRRMGKKVVHELCELGSKIVIAFPTKNVDIHSFLEGIKEENQDVIMIGGAADASGINNDTLVFNENEMTNSGVVAAVLNNEDLFVKTYTNYQWRPIGKTFTVNKVKDGIIYGIESKKPVQLIKKYLGEDFVKGLPKTGAEFPLLVKRNGREFTVFIKDFLSNGAIQVAGNVKEGDALSFAYVNIPKMIQDSLHDLKSLAKHSYETVFAYCSSSRKKLLKDYTSKEMELLNGIGKTTGFFSSSEFCSLDKEGLQVKEYTTTAIALSENEPIKKEIHEIYKYTIPEEIQSVITLTHLIEATSSEIKGLNQELMASEQNYKSLFNNNTDIIYSVDLKGRFTSANPSFAAAFGYDVDEIIGDSALNYVQKEDVLKVKRHFYNSLKGKEQIYELELLTKSEGKQHFQMKNIPITVNNEIIGIYGIGKNITDQKKIRDQMEQLAYYDSQTGLPNRVKFTEMIKEHIERAKKKKRKLAVLIIDMDRFKIINDSLGHYAGDQILKELTNRIKGRMPLGTYLGRFGGDKFILMMTKNVEVEYIRKNIKSLIESIRKPIFYNHQEFFVTASVGVSFYPNDGHDVESLLKNADTAMNQSKNAGGNRITYYSIEMNQEALSRLEMESSLRRAIMKPEFFLCYQPLMELNTGKIYGSEALIRWEHPVNGLISPGEFIPVAEETGLIDEIGEWVLQTACKQNKQWQESGLGNLIISVNVSAHQFQQPQFVKQVKRALHDSGLAPQYLHLELTESVMIRNINYSISVMQELQKLGVKVSIDDFGTGYSSLSYLKNLPIDYLKIDRSFINNLKVDTSDIAIVKAIITMGHGLSVKVVAEGVESKEQMDLLKELKCHYAQGFYINKPLRQKEFEEGLKNLMSQSL